MAAIKTALQDMDFFDHDFTPTFINANSFSVPGDQTARIVAGRQLKLFDATTHVRAVGSASYTVVTTISLGAGTALTSSLSSFAIGILNPSSLALPDRISASAIETTTLTASGAVVLKSTLSIDGAIVANSTLSLSGAATFNATLTVSGAVALLTTLTVGGAVVLQAALSVGTAVTIGTTLSVSGATALKSTLSVGGAAIIAGTITNPQVLKAFAAFSGVGVVTLQQNFNVTSITDNGVGDYTVNFTNALSSSAYCVLASCENNGAVLMVTEHNNAVEIRSATQYQIFTVNQLSGVVTDGAVVCVGFLGT